MSLSPPIRLGVLFGGRSSEHEVSLLSAREVMQAIDPKKYTIIPLGIDKAGSWQRLNWHPQQQLQMQGESVALLPDPTQNGLMTLAADKIDRVEADRPSLQGIDVIFPLLHGPYGEDGTVQGLLELAEIPYVGSGVLSSAVGMDKAIMKALFQQQGLPVAAYRVFLRSEWQQHPQAIQTTCEQAFPYPWFVKPANMGSSVGISKVHNADEFAEAMDHAAQFDRKILVEAGIAHAREIEVAVLGNDEPKISIAGEIIPSREFYDYQAKYLDGTSGLEIPADLPEGVIKTLQTMALTAFKAIDCAGLARVDFLVRGSDHAIFVSEINTMPGFTQLSMYPKLWEASGIAYAELIDQLIQLALERHRARQQNQLIIPHHAS